MIAHVARWGNSLALRIPAGFARFLSVDEGHAVCLTVASDSLVVTPVRDEPRFDLAELVSGINDENLHGEVRTASALGNEFA